MVTTKARLDLITSLPITPVLSPGAAVVLKSSAFFGARGSWSYGAFVAEAGALD